jgi:hypothetical protein
LIRLNLAKLTLVRAFPRPLDLALVDFPFPSSLPLQPERHAAQSEAKMRNVIFAINITIDGCCDHTNTIADEELLEHYAHSCEMLTCSSMGVKPIN